VLEVFKSPILEYGRSTDRLGTIFVRIPHKKIANFLLKRTYFDESFWTHRSMTPKMAKNDPKKCSFFQSSKSTQINPNHLKHRLKVRNDVYNRFRGFLEKIFLLFRACLRPKVKNLICMIYDPLIPLVIFSFGTLFSTVFMQKIRELTIFSDSAWSISTEKLHKIVQKWQKNKI
jgi:hypothetical protein